MNELRITGFINGRSRILLGIFWTKYLLLNPFNKKYGSFFCFSRLLIDAIGPTQNKMNHHWLTELDYAGKKYGKKGYPLSGRYFDISNHNIKKYDPEFIYIKKWIPKLSHLSIVEIKHFVASQKTIFNPINQYHKWIIAGRLH